VGSSTSRFATVGSTSGGPTATSASTTVTVTVASATSSTTTTTATSASSTGGPFGACTNAGDQQLLADHMGTIDQDLYNCTASNLNDFAGTEACLMAKDGLSPGCAACFALEGQCGSMACLNQCTGGVPNPACLACLAAHCNTAFTNCSGIPFPG
jgi:hypothetical protein